MLSPNRLALLGVFASLALVRSTPAAEADPLLPADCQLVASVQLRQLADASAVKKYLLPGLKDLALKDADLTKLLKAVSIDPMKDIDRAIIAGPAVVEADKTLLILRGRFDLARIHAGADDIARRDAAALRIQKEGDRRLYQLKAQDEAVPASFLCFLDKETAVASPARALVLDAIARKDGKKPAAVSKALGTLLARIDGQASAWFACLVSDDLRGQMSATGEAQDLASSLQTLRGTVTVGDGVQADFVIQTDNAKNAVEIRKFTEGVKGILILAVMNRDKQYGGLWADLLSALKVASDKEAVVVKGQVSAAQIEKSLQDVKKPKD